MVSAADNASAPVTDDSGETGRFGLDEQTRRRNYNGRKIPLETIPAFLEVGRPVIVTSEAGRANVIRPQC